MGDQGRAGEGDSRPTQQPNAECAGDPPRVGDTGVVPGFVDPRPGQEAALHELESRLAAATEEEERARLQDEIKHLERSMGRGHGIRRFFFGHGHRSVPW